ncbi:hypothetical protein ACFQE6_11465 [Natrinema soli]|uniref:MBL fold metallo-hydrolase n=1 Tax=Natrinema soli TaxID=1930624 RepID=A0ABD5SKM3_9EURY
MNGPVRTTGVLIETGLGARSRPIRPSDRSVAIEWAGTTINFAGDGSDDLIGA